MTPEQKKEASHKQHAHWERCRAVAEACDVRPGEVNKVWSSIKDFHEDTAKVKTLILKRRVSSREHWRTKHNPSRSREKPKNLTQAVRVMVWAIDTIDDLDLAKQAFDKAWGAVKEERQ